MPNRYWADLSNNNTQAVDWAAYRRAGHILVGLKATEGTSFIDHTHLERASGAHAHGLHVLHYHFGHPGEGARSQAQTFWNQCRGSFGRRDFACIDLEVTDGEAMWDVARWLDEFDREFRRYAGHTLIGYSDESFLEQLVRAKGAVAGNRWWIAAYGPGSPQVAGVTRWAHQFTDGAQGPEPHACAGIGHSDVSMLNVATWLRLRLRRP